MLSPTDGGHYTVYLPAYSDRRILETLLHFPEVHWEVFSKHTKSVTEEQNVFIRPIHDNLFLRSMATSKGVLCGAGFETPAEALFLKKKLLVIPMKGQYEQQCNAAALKNMGVPVIKSLKRKHIATIDRWLEEGEVIPVDYPDQTEAIIDRIITDFEAAFAPESARKAPLGDRFRKSLFQKIVAAYISA